MDDESGESMELMEEMPLNELGEAELERLVRGWRRGAGSWFQRRGEAYWKERSVIRKEDDVDGRASVTKDEDRVLRGGGYTDRPMKVGWLSEMVQGSPLSAETADTQSDRYCGACPVWMWCMNRHSLYVYFFLLNRQPM